MTRCPEVEDWLGPCIQEVEDHRMSFNKTIQKLYVMHLSDDLWPWWTRA